MEYDVFISCKSEDYIYAEEIYKFLTENGFNVFLASKELRKIGDSEYRKAISEALKATYHLIVFASKSEYIDSTWVYYEWDWFLIAKIKGKKQGQLLTILKDLNIDDVNVDLWKYESKTFDNYKETLLSYVETPKYLQRKTDAQEKARLEEEARKIKEQAEAEAKKEKIKTEIKEREAEYYRHSATLDTLAMEIVSKYKLLGEPHKICPVCSEEIFIDASFCKRCGWSFVPRFTVQGKSSDEHLFIARNHWNRLESLHNMCDREEFDKQHSDLENANQNLMEKQKLITSLENELFRVKELLAASYNRQQSSSELEKSLTVKGNSIKNNIVRKPITIPAGDVRIKMIYVEGGTFQMGATSEQETPLSNEEPVHTVTLDSYYIAETQVTNELWEIVMGSYPYKYKGNKYAKEKVSWDACQEFISKLNRMTGKRFRLPTEAEWEFAARGGIKNLNQTQYSGGRNLRKVGNFKENSSSVGRVGSKEPNDLGLYDMSGNVSEWCEDYYDQSFYKISFAKNPKGPKSGNKRVCRGGGWNCSAQKCRVAFRGHYLPDTRANGIGLRLVLSEVDYITSIS